MPPIRVILEVDLHPDSPLREGDLVNALNSLLQERPLTPNQIRRWKVHRWTLQAPKIFRAVAAKLEATP